MTGKSAHRHWKTANYKISGQLIRLDSGQTKLLKNFDGHLDDVKSHSAQKKTMSTERAYERFRETYDELEEIRQQ